MRTITTTIYPAYKTPRLPSAQPKVQTLHACMQCRYAVMTLSIGDSAAFSFRTASGTLTDLTSAWRLGAARDPRDCQGCLGFALGEDPDLSNMTLSLTTAAPGDILLLVSDGIVDNFDPVARKEAVLLGAASHRQEGVELPAILPQKAHMLTGAVPHAPSPSCPL